MRKWYFFAMLIIIFLWGCKKEEPLEPPYDGIAITPVTDRDYTSYLLSSFENSEESIHIIMYLMKYYPYDSTNGVSLLEKDLTDAEERGVEVKVILEWSDYNSSLNATNESTYVYLESNGIDVRFDPSSVTTHAKVVIVDEQIAFVGSTNWSRSAVEENNEVNLKITDKDVLEEIENYFEELWVESRSL
jgi:phosphatidylserine/phosphatidylglycerophosphate/cardiolipin synthase-like enzyme